MSKGMCFIRSGTLARVGGATGNGAGLCFSQTASCTTILTSRHKATCFLRKRRGGAHCSSSAWRTRAAVLLACARQLAERDVAFVAERQWHAAQCDATALPQRERAPRMDCCDGPDFRINCGAVAALRRRTWNRRKVRGSQGQICGLWCSTMAH